MNRYRRICSPLHEPFCQPANSMYQTHSVINIYTLFFLSVNIFFHNFAFFFAYSEKMNIIIEKNVLLQEKKMLKIAIASDHGGFDLKEKIIKNYAKSEVSFDDFGTHSTESVDYPDIVKNFVPKILSGNYDFGILICGTGIGVDMAANRHKKIRAALIYNDFCAQMAKEHNNANIIVFGGRTMSYEDVARRIDIFRAASFQGGRHQNRIDKLDEE